MKKSRKINHSSESGTEGIVELVNSEGHYYKRVMDPVHGKLVGRGTRKLLPRLAKEKQKAKAVNCVEKKLLPNEKQKPEALNNSQDSGLIEEGMKGEERAGVSNEISRLEGATVIRGGNRVRPLKLDNGRITYYRDEESFNKAIKEVHAMAAACRQCIVCSKTFTSEQAYSKHNKELHDDLSLP